MSNLMEDRLTAALHARAELVQPEGIRHQTLRPWAPKPVWRRPRVVVAVIAAAAVVAVALPFVLTSHDSRPLPADKIPKPVHSLTGDVDDDGRPDRLSTSGTTLTLRRASDPDHPTTTKVPHLAGLIGLVDAGVYGRGIVVASGGTTVRGGLTWSVYILRGGGALAVAPLSLAPVDEAHVFSGGLGVVPGQVVSWITPGGQLVGGVLDPVQEGADKLSVNVSRYEFEDEGYSEKPLGRWCWDTTSQSLPAPCSTGETFAFDPGPHGSLPALLPSASPDWIMNVGSGSETWHDGTTRLRIAKARPHVASVFKQVFSVKGTLEGRPVSVPLGKGPPDLLETFVDLGHGVRGLVARVTARSTWTLLAITRGGLVRLAADDPSGGAHGQLFLHPGTVGLFVDGTPRAANTWIGPDGQVFTRVETDDLGRYDVYEWQVTDSSGTTLASVDLGTICIDDFQGTYGTCR